MSAAQKAIKYLALALAIFIIISIFSGLYFAGSLLGGVVTNDNDTCRMGSYSAKAKVLCVSINSSVVEISKSDEAKVDTNNKYIKYEIKDNKIIVREEKHSFFKNINDKYVKIFIPENLKFDEVYISNGAGKMTASDITTNNFELELGAVATEINNIVSNNKTTIDSGVGKLDINNSRFNNLDLDAGVGELTLNAKLLNSAEIDAGVGEINLNLLDTIDNYRISAEKGIGSIRLNGQEVRDERFYGNGTNYIDIDGGVGSIKITSKEK